MVFSPRKIINLNRSRSSLQAYGLIRALGILPLLSHGAKTIIVSIPLAPREPIKALRHLIHISEI